MKWTLPSSLDVGGKPWVIHADYRDILDIINRLTDINTDRQIALYVALALFYEDFDVMPENCFEEAIKQCCGLSPAGRMMMERQRTR